MGPPWIGVIENAILQIISIRFFHKFVGGSCSYTELKIFASRVYFPDGALTSPYILPGEKIHPYGTVNIRNLSVVLISIVLTFHGCGNFLPELGHSKKDICWVIFTHLKTISDKSLCYTAPESADSWPGYF